MMEGGFDWTPVIATVSPLVTGFLATLYVGWRAKVTADGISDWRDDVVNAVDDFVGKTRMQDEEAALLKTKRDDKKTVRIERDRKRMLEIYHKITVNPEYRERLRQSFRADREGS